MTQSIEAQELEHDYQKDSDNFLTVKLFELLEVFNQFTGIIDLFLIVFGGKQIRNSYLYKDSRYGNILSKSRKERSSASQAARINVFQCDLLLTFSRIISAIIIPCLLGVYFYIQTGDLSSSLIVTSAGVFLVFLVFNLVFICFV